jgi:hypothetical protein
VVKKGCFADDDDDDDDDMLRVRASEDCSCLRPRGYRDRLGSERAKTVHALDRSATVTGI